MNRLRDGERGRQRAEGQLGTCLCRFILQTSVFFFAAVLARVSDSTIVGMSIFPRSLRSE